MPETSELLLAVCMFFGAALYSSVGHAGASAYIAFMALFGVAPVVMRPTALALNILAQRGPGSVVGGRAPQAAQPSSTLPVPTATPPAPAVPAPVAPAP